MLQRIFSKSGKLLWQQKNLFLIGALILSIPYLFKVFIISSFAFNFDVTLWAEENKWIWLIIVIFIGVLSWVISVIGSAGIYSKVIANVKRLETSNLRKYLPRFLSLSLLIELGMFALVAISNGDQWLRWFFYGTPSFRPSILPSLVFWLLSWCLSLPLVLGKAAIVSDDVDVISSIRRGLQIIKTEPKTILVIVLGITLLNFIPLHSSQGIGWFYTASIPWSDPFFFEYFLTSFPYELISFLFQVILITFTQTLWAVSYLQLTQLGPDSIVEAL